MCPSTELTKLLRIKGCLISVKGAANKASVTEDDSAAEDVISRRREAGNR